MNFKNLSLLIILFGLLVGCSNSSDSKCSKAENVDDSECIKTVNDIDSNPISLSLEFIESYYYDTITKSWVAITSDNLNGGVVGSTVPVYSSFLNMSVNDAIESIEEAKAQKTDPASYLPREYNIIPYLEVKYEKGITYVYNYQKKDLNGNPVTNITGQMIVKNNRVYLPFINAMFQNQFYSATEQIGKRYIHSIAISMQSSNSQPTNQKRIEFESNLQAPIVDFFIDYSPESEAFNLVNRWSSIFSGNDNVANENFPFFTLRQNDQAQAVPVSLKFLFKNRPKLEYIQEVFFESPLDIDKFKTQNVVEVIRGQSFYVSTVNLDSTNHFRMKVRVNGADQTLVDGREITINNFPANTPWDVDFLYDFRPNAAYSNEQGIQLITPFKPTCQEITNSVFNPLQSKANKATYTQTGGFMSICHPETNAQLLIPANQLLTTQFSLSDVYYDFFNYVPLDTLKNVAGHFNGIRSVKLRLEGCIRVYVKTPTDTEFQLKSVTSSACVEEGEVDSEGWVYFSAEKSYTINDLINNYDGIPGLRQVIQSFGTNPIRRTPYFKFNGLVNDLNHIY